MKRLFFIALSILTLTGCELIEKIIGYDYERVKWINPDVECCGVKDPLNNLAWLNDWYKNSYFNKKNDYPTYEIIYLFHNDSTLDDFIVTKTFGYNYSNYFQLFTCKGEWLDEGRYYDYNSDYANPDILYQKSKMNEDKDSNVPIPYCESCDFFFETHTLVDTIAYFYVKRTQKK